MNAVLDRPAPLRFTDDAVQRVRALIEDQDNPALKLRIFVTGGGCAGFQYGFSFEAEANDEDIAIEQDGVTFLVDVMSRQYLSGALVDYIESLEGARFIIENPNAATSCGCGSSFAV